MTVEKFVKNAVLEFLSDADRFTITEVIKETGYRESSVRAVLIRLHDQGIIKKVAIGADRRMIYEVTSDEKLAGESAAGKMDVFEECKKVWAGYQIHKIFGSAGRGC